MAAKNTEARFWTLIEKRGPDDCWLWQGGIGRKGYGVFQWEGRLQRAHRLAYKFAVGLIPVGKLVCHSCDVPPCCNPGHLFVGTHTDNMQDMVAKGRYRFNGVNGERHWNHKLTRKQALAILKLRAKGWSYGRLAHKFKRPVSTVRDVCKGYTWKVLAKAS
jgi:hypothetical protein